MDALSLVHLVKNTLKQKEYFDTTAAPAAPAASTPAPAQVQPQNNSTNVGWTAGMIFYIIFVVLFGGYAAYLSWKSNSLINWGAGWKIFYAFFAFVFSIYYLISHLIHKGDLIAYIRRSHGENV